MSKQDKISSFDPNGLGDANNNIFGLPFTTEEAEVVLIPVPWEVTVSYTAGTALGPQAIFDASFQVDLFDPKIKDAWKIGIAMEPVSDDIASKSESLRRKSDMLIYAYVPRGSDCCTVKISCRLRKTKAYIIGRRGGFEFVPGNAVSGACKIGAVLYDCEFILTHIG